MYERQKEARYQKRGRLEEDAVRDMNEATQSFEAFLYNGDVDEASPHPAGEEGTNWRKCSRRPAERCS